MKPPANNNQPSKNQWDHDRLKKEAEMLIYAYSGDQIHSIFVTDSVDDYNIILQACVNLSPPITRTEKKDPTPENWTFVEKHYDDDLGVDTTDRSQQIALFNRGGIIIHMPGIYVIAWANPFYKGSH